MIGIDNDFILKKIFGIDNIFGGSKIYNINWNYCSERMELELIVNSKVENPPAKWKEWREVYIRIDFLGIQNIKTDIKSSEEVITSWKIIENNGKFVLYVHHASKELFQIKFEIAHIQNIKPIN